MSSLPFLEVGAALLSAGEYLAVKQMLCPQFGPREGRTQAENFVMFSAEVVFPLSLWAAEAVSRASMRSSELCRMASAAHELESSRQHVGEAYPATGALRLRE